MHRTLLVGLLAISLAVVLGCSYAELTAAGRRVLAAPNLKVQHCRLIGTVVGQGGGGGGGWVGNASLIQYAMNDLRNKAAAMGATHVVTGNPTFGTREGTTTSATVTGTAYRCP